MMLTRTWMLALLIPFGMPAPAVAPVPVPVVQCNGCTGMGGSNSASGGTCGGFVSINVVVNSGKCKWFFSPDWMITCRQIYGCTPQVDRSWSGLDPGSTLDFCITTGDETMCLDPKPVASSGGSGSDSRPSSSLLCQDGGTRTYSVASPSCGLSASATGSCSSCTGSVPNGE